MKNFYDILALPRNATSEQVRSRFRELARLRHPDRFQGSEKESAELEFQEITEAFNVLSNPEQRRSHDSELAQPVARSQAADPAQLAKVFLQRGIRAYKEKDYREAAANFDRATSAQPDNAKAWHHLALACSHQRRFLAKATVAIARACDLDPMNFNYLRLAGRIFDSSGQLTRAEQYYSEAQKWGGGSDSDIEERLKELRKVLKKGKSGFFGKAG